MQQILNKYWLLVEGIWVFIVLFFQFFCMLKKVQVKKLGKGCFFFLIGKAITKLKLREQNTLLFSEKKKKKHLSQGSPTMHNGTKETIS